MKVKHDVKLKALFKLSFVWVLLCITSLNVVAQEMGAQSAAIVISKNNNFQQQSANVIQDELHDANIDSVILYSDQLDVSFKNHVVYIAIGENSIRRYTESGIKSPVLHVSNNTDATINHDKKVSHLLISQHACMQLKLIKLLDSKWTSIAVLASNNSLKQASEIVQCAIKLNINVLVYSVENTVDLTSILEKAISTSKVILSVADPSIYNRYTIKNILLTLFRSRVPVIGFSESFVDAGAIAGVFTSPGDIGKTAAHLVIDFFENTNQFKDAINYPVGFTVKTNRRVAQSFEIELPDEEDIQSELEEAEDL